MSYKILSIIQVVFIFLLAFSWIDLGYVAASGQADGLIFNSILFQPDGLIYEILKDIDFWGMYQFWGYCLLVVAICQLIKVFTVDI
jgi:hypothetical protein